MTPHSFACWTIFSACACSSSALVGMQPHSRHVPPSAFCFSTTATVEAELRGADRGDVAAGARADHDDVVFAGSRVVSEASVSTRSLQRRQRHEVRRARRGRRASAPSPGRAPAPGGHARAQLPVLVPQLPVRFGQPFEPPGDAPRAQERGKGDKKRPRR